MRRRKSDIETKSENKQAVYRFIQMNESATKQEIYTGLGLSLPTIKQSIEFLEANGVISSSDVIRNTGGRNATAYRILDSGRFAVGLYLSLNHVIAVCVDLSGNIIYTKRQRLGLNAQDDDYLQQIAKLVEECINNSRLARSKFLGVGIAVPSLVSDDGESIIFGMTRNFAGITRTVLAKYIPYPTKLFHDSFVAGFAEVWKRPKVTNAVYINLNNSIGGSIIINNKLYKGNNHRSGEIGHMLMYPQTGKKCYCGQVGCFDTVCNAGVLDKHTDGNLQEFFRLVALKDERILNVWYTYLDNLAIAVHNLRMLYDCEIILGGHVGSYIENYIEGLWQRVDKLNIFDKPASTYVLPCKYKNEATAAGAAIQMIENFIHAF